MVPAVISRLHVIPAHTGRHFSPREVRLDCRKSCQNSGGKAFGSSIILPHKASMPTPSSSRPTPVLIIDCKCEKRRPSLPAPDKALQELMTSRATCGSNSSSGRRLGILPSSWSEELAATAAAEASETQAWFSSGNFAFTRSHVSSFPGARGSARRLRAATVTPPRWRHADDALVNISAAVSPRAWPICLVDVRRVYSINHGSKRVRSPRSADANLSRRSIRPSCECSKARRTYHNLIDLRSDCGASDCVDWRCSPKA